MFSTNSVRTRVYHREAMHLQVKEVEGISAIFDIQVGEDNPLHPSFYFSPSKNVFWAPLSLPKLSVPYNRWSRNRELWFNDILFFLFLWLDTKGFSLSKETRIYFRDTMH